MPKNSSKYKQGDIVVLELPFTDLLGSKLRPVLVLNAVDLGDASKGILLCHVSQQIWRASRRRSPSPLS